MVTDEDNGGKNQTLATLGTLANLVSLCQAAQSPQCGELLRLTAPPGGTVPGNTVQAVLNLVRNPSLSPAGLFALHRAHVPGPYVLAGHSFGGLYVRIFAARYPSEVAGMVLIDSTGSALPASTSAQSWGPDDILARASVLASTTARLGVGRLSGPGGGYGTLPPQSADEVRAKIATSTSLRSSTIGFVSAALAANIMPTTSATQALAPLDAEDPGEPHLGILAVVAILPGGAVWKARVKALSGPSRTASKSVTGGAMPSSRRTSSLASSRAGLR